MMVMICRKTLEALQLKHRRMLAEWLLLETRFPAPRPPKVGRTLSAKRTKLVNEFGIQADRVEGEILHVYGKDIAQGDNWSLCITLERLVGDLVMEGEAPQVVIPGWKPPTEEECRNAVETAGLNDGVIPSAVAVADLPKRPRRRDPKLNKVLDEYALLATVVESLVDEDEQRFIEGRLIKYMSDFPEMNIAPDEAQLATLLIHELALRRLQIRAARSNTVDVVQIEKAQKAWTQAATGLGITRDQRLKRGESGGQSVADLVLRYDELQREALRQFERDLPDEAAVLETSRQRQQRELQPGQAEAVLRDEFRIGVDAQEHRMALLPEPVAEPLPAVLPAAELETEPEADDG